MSKYSLIINFESLDEKVEFTTTYNKIYNKAEQKIIKTSNDKRGSKTVGLHLRAKQYRAEHPELSYRQCLIEVSKQQEQQQPELIEVEAEEPIKKTFEIYEDNLII